MVQYLQQQEGVEGIAAGVKTHSSTFIKDFPIPPPSYFLWDIYTLPSMTSSGAQGGTSASRGRGRTMIATSRSVTTTSSHCRNGSLELRLAIQEMSIDSPLMHRGQEVGETSGQTSSEGKQYKDALKD